MTYQTPYSSSPPSTPDRRLNNGRNDTLSYGTNPSTTPAGPPPSSAGSFTPQGLPPSSFLGSSVMDITSPVKSFSYSKQSSYGITSSPSASFMRSQVEPQTSVPSNDYQTTPQRSFQTLNNSNEEEEVEEEEGGDADGEDDYMDDDEDQDHQDNQRGEANAEEMMTDEEVSLQGEEKDDYRFESVRPSKHKQTYDQVDKPDTVHSWGNATISSREQDSFASKDSIRATQKRVSMFDKIAKDLYSHMPATPTDESDDLILKTEKMMQKMYEYGIGEADDEAVLQETLSTVPSELTMLWEDYYMRVIIRDSHEYSPTIGPGSRAPNFAKANFLAGITLKIHHPGKISTKFTSRTKLIPEVMLDWIDKHHNPYPSQLQEVMFRQPSPANHHLFWDSVFNSLIRGKIVDVINVLKHAGWRHAWNETDISRGQLGRVGFSGIALRNVEQVVSAAVEILVQCPASKGDWNIRNNEWTMFRLRGSQALEDLRSFAEGRNKGRENFSVAESGSYSRAVKKAESQVPWHIYQNLVTLYNLVLGDENAIVANSQDWCEATVGLLIWWNESKGDGRTTINRRSSFRGSDAEAYEHKLRRAFELAVADTTDFQVNSLDEIEVGLASLFEGDSEAVIGFLRGWSGPLSSAVSEVASLAGWLPPAEEKNLINMGGLDDDDLDVLGLNSSPSKTDGVKDKTLIKYAHSLLQRRTLQSTAMPGEAKKGWELAIAVLGRLDAVERSETMIGGFLKELPLDSPDTVDTLWKLLNEIGMSHHAENIAESYADSLAEVSFQYGTVLWYYSLAHKKQKVKDVLDLLISFSLVQSIAYPPQVELDGHLEDLILSPKKALTKLSELDPVAAELLHKTLSGYATLRKFYSLRDEQVQLLTRNKSRFSGKARKAQAAAALIAVIASSDDNIRGGLFDEERRAVVSVDFLLALLGEAMVFVNQSDYSITVAQIEILLKAIEDLQTVGPRVYSACTEFLQTVIASGQGIKGSTPTDMLRKSTSNVSGSSFSMVGSSMLASQLKQSMSSSGVLVKGNVKRGWDWRRYIDAGVTGEDVLRILRHGLAKDLAKAWLLEADNRM